MTIVRRDQVVLNLVAFVALSLCHLHVARSIAEGGAALDPDRWTAFVLGEAHLFAAGALAAWSVFSVRRWSWHAFLVFCALVLWESLVLVHRTEDKAVLLGTFLFSVLAFLLGLFWREELASSVFHPGFHEDELGRRNRHGLNVGVRDASGAERGGFLTSWDGSSCFVCLEDGDAGGAVLRDPVELSLRFRGREVRAAGRVMTAYAGGFGIRLFGDRRGAGRGRGRGRGKKGPPLGWGQFHAIIMDRFRSGGP